MTTSDEKRETSDVEELTALPDEELRREVTRVLEPGPWEHSLYYDDRKITRRPEPGRFLFYCGKCKKANIPACAMVYGPKIVDTQDTCPVPDAAEGSWADLAHSLLRKLEECSHLNMLSRIEEALEEYRPGIETLPEAWTRWMMLDPREQVIVCLLALQGEKP